MRLVQAIGWRAPMHLARDLPAETTVCGRQIGRSWYTSLQASRQPRPEPNVNAVTCKRCRAIAGPRSTGEEHGT
jgi:hypothetical protein